MAEWVCGNCGAEVEEEFDVCWQCGATRDGDVDESFVKEVDAAKLPPDWVARIQCEACGYRGKAIRTEQKYGVTGWLVSSVLGGALFAFASCNVCPKCGERKRLLDWNGDDEAIAPSDMQVWQEEMAKRSSQRQDAPSWIVLSLVFVAFMILLWGLWKMSQLAHGNV